MNAILSCIVPCYNVEKYLQACLDSLFNSSLDEDNLEILCIDDGSPDGSLDILKKNAAIHNSIRIISHQYNKGLGGARNTGIREAKGKYIWFVDADDMVSGDKLNSVISYVCAQNLDVLCFNYRKIDNYGNEISFHKVFTRLAPKSGYGFINDTFGPNIVNHMGFVWRLIYRTEYLREHDLSFPEKVYWEDTAFMPKSILEAKRIASIDDVLYSYRVNPGSISGTFSKAYPAKHIFDWAFNAGPTLLEFSKGVQDKDLQHSFFDVAINKYINGFPIFLFRTSKLERKEFYQLVRRQKRIVRPLESNMKPIARLVLLPIIGPIACDIASCIYRLKHNGSHITDNV